KVTTNFDYAPDLATKWEMPDDKTIVFHLNPNAKFHTGQPVKASDVKWTYESLMNPTFTTSKRSGYASVDHIEIPDQQTVIFELNAIPFENVAEFEKNPDFTVVKSPGSVYQYLAFNCKDPALAKPLVRQAIAHAIDRERIIRDIQRGYAQPTETMLAEGHWARATNLPEYNYDPAKAKQLLAQAGYPNG